MMALGSDTVQIRGEMQRVQIVTQKKGDKLSKRYEDDTTEVKFVLPISVQVSYFEEVTYRGHTYIAFKIEELGKKRFVTVRESEYTQDVKVYSQMLKTKGVNLPSIAEVPYKEIKAKIRTVNPKDYLQYSYHGGKTPTHEVSYIYQEGVKASDIIEWGERKFEVISTENVDELDRLIKVEVIEVLSG